MSATITVTQASRTLSVSSFKNGLPTVFFVFKREHISKLHWYDRIRVRWAYFRVKWTSEYSVQGCGIFTSQVEADIAAERGANETGEMYCVIELPINSMLPPSAVNFGYQKFYFSNINSRYQERPLDVVNVEEVRTMQRESQKVTAILKSALS